MAGFGADVAKLIVLLSLDDRGFTAGMNRAKGSISQVDRGFSQMGRGVSSVGRGLSTLGTRAALAAAGGLTAVVTTAASFEQAFTGIEKTVNETANTTFPELEASIRQMARSIPVSFEELAGIGEAGGALGIATDDLEDFIDVVARLSVSTNLSSDQAATALGQLGNVLHLRGDDFRNFADSLVALGNAGASTEDQIVQIATRFAAAGQAAGLSTEDILGLGSAVASMGIEVEAGGSALSRIFNSVATNIGTSSDKAVAFAKTLGLSAAEFRRAWEKDALGTFQDFLGELNKMDQFTQARVLKGIGITNVRDVNTVRLMAQNIGLVNDQLKISRNAQGDLNKESQKFFDTTSGQWKVLINNLRDAGVTIGKELLPVVKDMIKEFTTFLNDPKTVSKLKTFGQDLAKGARELLTSFKAGEFNPLIENLKGAAAVAKGAFDAFNALPGPVKQFAIAALVANKVSGGALGQITGGLANIFAGGLKAALGVGGIWGRGSSPMNPLYVSATGLPGVGGPGGPGGLLRSLGGGSLLAGALTAGIATSITAALVGLIAAGEGAFGGNKQRAQDIVFNRNAATSAQLPGGGGPVPVKIVGSTPLGQFNPANKGGVPVKIINKALFDTIGDAIDSEKRTIKDALKDGDIHEARIAQKLLDANNRLRGTVDKRVSDIIPHLGEVNRALSVSNRKLDEGNARQRDIASGIREARDRIGTGFQRSNDQLGVIARKPTSFTANVTNNITATLSTYQSLQTMTRINQIRTGFSPGDSTGGSI